MLSIAVACTLSLAPKSLLVFSRTVGFRHDSIPIGRQAILDIAIERGWTAAFSEDPSALQAKALKNYDVIVFLNTTGDFLGKSEEKALQGFVKAGGGVVGIHAAADAEYENAWYGDLIGGYFKRHPAQQNATVKIEDPSDPCMKHLPNPWTRWDEWYDYKVSPRGKVTILASLVPESYKDHSMGDDHPITWKHDFDGGRCWYTGMGHTQESYKDPLFLKMVAEGIDWASGSSKRRP